ncbi:Dabb family protein [Methylomagnum sp.]
MKQAIALLLALFAFLFNTAGLAETVPPTNGKVNHVVIVWLKDHGPQARQQYIEATRNLAKLPMVLSYTVGAQLPALERKALDASYDLAVVATFADPKALDDYLKHPEHSKTLTEKLKPLVDKVVVYDFASVQ